MSALIRNIKWIFTFNAQNALIFVDRYSWMLKCIYAFDGIGADGRDALL